MSVLHGFFPPLSETQSLGMGRKGSAIPSPGPWGRPQEKPHPGAEAFVMETALDIFHNYETSLLEPWRGRSQILTVRTWWGYWQGSAEGWGPWELLAPAAGSHCLC